MLITTENQKTNLLKIKQKGKVEYLDLSEVVYLYADSYLVTLHLKCSKRVSVTKALKSFEEELGTHGFVRINRNTLVNRVFVECYTTQPQRCVKLCTGELFSVSRRKAYLFK